MNAPNRPINRKGLLALLVVGAVLLLLTPWFGMAGSFLAAILLVGALLVFTLLRVSRIL